MSNQIDLNSSRLEFLKRRQFPAANDHHPNGATKFMNPTVYKAVSKGNVTNFIDIIEELSTEMQISLTAIVMQLSPIGNSPLHEAVVFEHKELAAVLASHFPFLLSMNNFFGDSVLHVASRKGNLAIAQLVIAAFEEHFPHKAGTEDSLVRVKNGSGNTALHEAVINGEADTVEFLVKKDVAMWYRKNDKGKSPLYLAVQGGDLCVVKILLGAQTSNVVHNLQGHSPVHAAIVENRLDMLKEVFERQPELFQVKDVKKRNPLHLAAYLGYLDGIEFLLSKSGTTSSFAFEHDEDGQLPIHIPCKVRHLSAVIAIKAVKQLLGQWPNPSELLDKQERNILHIAATSGRAEVVRRMLQMSELGLLINQRDKDGNTPIHLATFNWYPLVLYYLALDKRAKVNLVNEQCSTAFDFVKKQTFGFHQPLRKRLTNAILVSAGAHRSKDLIICNTEGWNLERAQDPPNQEFLKDKINSRMIMATLVAAVTFAAGFSNPVGFNRNSKMNRELLQVFVISNAIAMYTSILVIILLLWAQFGDPFAAMWAINLGSVPLSVSLMSMSVAFMAGTFVAVGAISSLANTLLIVLGIFSVSFMSTLSLSLYFPFVIRLPVLRHLSSLVIFVAVVISGSLLPPSKDLLKENLNSAEEPDHKTNGVNQRTYNERALV